MEKEVAKILLEAKAVTLSPGEPYIYASGIKSPIYCDNRLLMSFPDKRKQIVKYFLEKIKDFGDFDVVAGTSTAGISWAAWISASLEKPMAYIRGKSKEHGKQNLIEGKAVIGQKVLVIEDLVSTGGSSIAAVEAVREAGGDVVGCVAIFTYELEKAKKRFEEAKCKIITLSNFSTLVEVASETEYITEEDKAIVLEWNKAPADWGKKHGFE